MSSTISSRSESVWRSTSRSSFTHSYDAAPCASWLPEELSIHAFAERFVARLEAGRIRRLRVGAGNVTELILVVGGGFVHHLGDLVRRGVGAHRLRVRDHAHHSIDEPVIGLVPAGVERAREEIGLHAA